MDKRKVIIVGASHGGHESAIELLDKYDDVDVTIYEAGDFISFMSCGMQLFLEIRLLQKMTLETLPQKMLRKRAVMSMPIMK